VSATGRRFEGDSGFSPLQRPCLLRGDSDYLPAVNGLRPAFEGRGAGRREFKATCGGLSDATPTESMHFSPRIPRASRQLPVGE